MYQGNSSLSTFWFILPRRVLMNCDLNTWVNSSFFSTSYLNEWIKKKKKMIWRKIKWILLYEYEDISKIYCLQIFATFVFFLIFIIFSNKCPCTLCRWIFRTTGFSCSTQIISLHISPHNIWRMMLIRWERIVYNKDLCHSFSRICMSNFRIYQPIGVLINVIIVGWMYEKRNLELPFLRLSQWWNTSELRRDIEVIKFWALPPTIQQKMY